MARKNPTTKTVTSRSLTISTPNFCFDLTWRKVEIEMPLPLPAKSRAPGPPAPDFAETLQRKQVSQLLGPLREPSCLGQPLPVSLGPLTGPSQAQVCGHYQRAADLLTREN
jgi:hypothetical protein